MSFTVIQNHFVYGVDWMHPVTDKYCTSDLSSCTVVAGRALVFTDPSTTPGCASGNTCRVVSHNCNTVVDTYYDGTSVKKSAFNITWWYHIGASFNRYPLFGIGLDSTTVDTFLTHGTPASIYSLNLLGNNNAYLPLSSLWFPYWKQYNYGTEYVVIAQYTGGFSRAQLYHCVGYNQWIIGVVGYLMSAESSPVAVIPLDYDRDYLPYPELRRAFAYSYDGVSQFGWNVQDMINVLKDIYQDRAWAVFDDRTYVLYLYNLTPEFVPDWLMDRLAPISMKVLKSPSHSSVAKVWMDEINRRNAYNTPPSAEA
jgi:hypothetical protein